jgi:DNA modification methylase
LYSDYLEDIVTVFQKCYELSHADATFWLIADTFRKNGRTVTLPFDINTEFQKRFNGRTWNLKEIIIWDKEKNLPWNGKGKFKNQFEYVLFYTKNENYRFNVDSVREIDDLKKWWKKYPERYNPDGKAPSNVWEFSIPLRGWGNGKQKHLCPFPFPLVEKILSISSKENDLVFDPFAGSGTVLALAKQMNRNSIGIDINKKYKKLFEEEVLLGAKDYWSKRVIELEQMQIAFSDFKKNNEKLRKLKTLNFVAKHINEINSHQFIYLAVDTNKNNLIKLYVIKSRVTPNISIEDEKILHLLSQTKIKMDFILISPNQIREKFKNTKLYKYQYEKFFSFTSSTKIKNILDNTNPYNYIYSDIQLKIS